MKMAPIRNYVSPEDDLQNDFPAGGAVRIESVLCAMNLIKQSIWIAFTDKYLFRSINTEFQKMENDWCNPVPGKL